MRSAHAVLMLHEDTAAAWSALFAERERPVWSGRRWRLLHKTHARPLADDAPTLYRQYVFRAC